MPLTNLNSFSTQQLESLRQSCLDDFGAFCILFMDEGFYDLEYHSQVAHFLQTAPSNRRLVIMPRSFLKTSIITRYLLWRAIKNPNLRTLYLTNSDTNAVKKVQVILDIVEKNNLFQALFPEVVPNFNRVRWSASCAELNRSGAYEEGTFEAAGTRTKIIGRHYNIICEDDTVCPDKDDIHGTEMMPKREDIEQAIGWHKLASPLLVNPTDEIIVSGTRWCNFDLINHILTNEKRFAVCNIAAYKRDADGELTDVPAYSRYPVSELDALKDSLGTYMYNALYRNSPTSSEHAVFLANWFRISEAAETDGDVWITVDPIIKPKKTSDFAVAMAVRHTPGRMLVEDYINEKIQPTALIAQAIKMGTRLNCAGFLVENINFQEMVVMQLKDALDRLGIPKPVRDYGSQQSKTSRIHNLQPLYEAKRIFHRRGMGTLEGQLMDFPYAKYDDLADALAMQLTFYKRAAVGPDAPPPGDGAFKGWTLGEILGNIAKRKHSGYQHM